MTVAALSGILHLKTTKIADRLVSRLVHLKFAAASCMKTTVSMLVAAGTRHTNTSINHVQPKH